MFVSTVFAISLLCLAFNTTKLFGLVGMTLLSYLYPLLLSRVSHSGWRRLVFHSPSIRRIFHELYKLPTRCVLTWEIPEEGFARCH